jgi:hypothetical protein
LLVRPATAEAFVELDGAFGPMRVGTTLRRKIKLYNPGGTELVASVAAAPPVFTFEGLADTTVHVAARGMQEWTVACHPAATGIQSADITLTVGSATKTFAVSCEALADGPPRLAIWPKRVRFGRVPEGQTVEETIHLANRGQSDLNLSGIVPVGAPSASLSLTSPAASLAPGQETTITLRFASAVRGTHHTGIFRVDSDDPVSALEHFQIAASGDAVDPAPSGGVPDWVWWAIAGAFVAGFVTGVLVARVLDDDEEGS